MYSRSGSSFCAQCRSMVKLAIASITKASVIFCIAKILFRHTGMTFLQKIKARIVDKFSGGVGTKDIRKQLDSLVSEDRDYALKHLPHHMVEAGRFEQLHQWLTDFDFINAKVSASGV